jgi:Flp pilus assembly protein TadG
MLLFALFLGIIEFGVLMMRQFTLAQVGREGARAASLGRPVEQITQRIRNTAGALDDPSTVTIALAYSTDDGNTYPNTLGNDGGGHNNAPPGSLIKVHLDYPYHFVTGTFFSFLSRAQGDVMPLSADVVMRRE